MKMTIVEKDFDLFFETAFHVYPQPKSPFASMMKSDLKSWLSLKNPLFDSEDQFSFFVAVQSGKPVGRIVVHCHPSSNAVYARNECYFGFFDVIDDELVGRSLLDKAEAWAKARGFNLIRGNFNLTAMQQIGVMIDGFDRVPYTDQVYSAPHIARILVRHGYQSEFPMTTFEIDLQTAPQQTLSEERRVKLVQDGIHVKKITKYQIKERMGDARLVLNDGFAHNPMFVPVTEEEFFFQAKDMTLILDPDIAAIAYDDQGPVGVVVCIPDLNPMLKMCRSRIGWRLLWAFLRFKFGRRRRAVIIYYSVVQRMQGQGINSLLLEHVMQQLRRKGYEKLGLTWIADENKASLRQAEKMGGTPLHKLCLFSKELAI